MQLRILNVGLSRNREPPPTWLCYFNGEHAAAPWDFGKKNTTHQTNPNRSKFKPCLFLRGYYVLSGNQTWHLESPYFYGDLSGKSRFMVDLPWPCLSSGEYTYTIYHHDYCNH